MQDLKFFAFTADEVTALRKAACKQASEMVPNYDATIIAMTKLTLAEEGPGDSPMSQQFLKEIVFANRDRPDVIVSESNEIACTLPMRTNGHVTFVVFPDQSTLVWDLERGFGHPGN